MRLIASIRQMEAPHSITLRPIAAPVIPSRRVRLALTDEALNRCQVDASIEQVASERASEIVGHRDMGDRLLGAAIMADVTATPD